MWDWAWCECPQNKNTFLSISTFEHTKKLESVLQSQRSFKAKSKMCLPIFQIIESVIEYFFDEEDISKEEEPVSHKPVIYNDSIDSTSTGKMLSTSSSQPKPSVPSKLVQLKEQRFFLSNKLKLDLLKQQMELRKTLRNVEVRKVQLELTKVQMVKEKIIERKKRILSKYLEIEK